MAPYAPLVPEKGGLFKALTATALVSAAVGGIAVSCLKGYSARGTAAETVPTRDLADARALTRHGNRGDGVEFSYESLQTGNWPKRAGACDPKTANQAPINIHRREDYPEMSEEASPHFWAEDGGCTSAYFAREPLAWKIGFFRPEDGVDCRNLGVVFKGKAYQQIHTHFHTLSEDTVDFVPYAMQAHMVHRAEDGDIVVVGVFMSAEEEEENTFVERAFGEIGFHHSRAVETSEDEAINPYDLLKLGRHAGKFWVYQGALTHPPCREGSWFIVAQDPVPVKKRYIKQYRDCLDETTGNSYGLNNRPAQPLNGRVIKVGQLAWHKGDIPEVHLSAKNRGSKKKAHDKNHDS